MFGVFNGEILPIDEIKIAPNDLGLARGYAVFDFFRVNGKPVFIEDHLKRLYQSAQEIRLPFHWSMDELKSMVHQMVEMNDLPKSGVKILVTGGYSPDGFHCVEPNIIITQNPIEDPNPEWYVEGQKLITHTYLRDSPTAKTTSYGQALFLQKEQKEHGAIDVLYHYDGNALETARSNVFLIKNGILATAEEHILGGITRSKVIEIASQHMEVQVRPIKLQEVYEADEVFLTSTMKRVLPVVQIDKFQIGKGVPGKLTNRLMELFRKYEESYLMCS
ncbi:MAG: aminotransferase class IV [bacterium]|nr:aminotransferase class IV [bacterium]